MAKVRRRKGNRFEPRMDTPVILYVAAGRLESTLVNYSDTGIAILLPSAVDLELHKNIRILYERRQQMVKVSRIEKTEEGDVVGLRFLG